jgi:translation initiation factor 1
VARRRKKDAVPVDTRSGGELTHNPFGALHDLQAPPSSPQPNSDPAPAAQAPRSATAHDAILSAAKLVVRRERAGRGGKTVTRVSGLPAGALPDVARRLKTALGCGATFEELDLLLLGDLVERAATWLEGEGARRVVRGN